MIIVLDSTPLGLMLQKSGLPAAEQCRKWALSKAAAGNRLVIPAIIDYEIRRELIRLKRTRSLKALDVFLQAAPNRVLPIDAKSLSLAAELWATARQRGTPTADSHALDVDVILCAQVLNAGFDMADVVVATSNARHIGQFVPAQDWQTI